MPPYKVILFDFDGTLCATDEAILYTFRKTFEQEGVPAPTPEKIRQGIGTGGNLSTILPFLYPTLEEDTSGQTLAHWVKTYRKIYDTNGGKRTTLFNGVEMHLQNLKKKGKICVVLSNKGQQAIEDALKHFELLHFFDLVIGDNPALPLEKKPHPMAFHKVIQPKYPTVKPAEFLMVGDTPPDLLFAQHAGIASCWAAYGYGDPDLCRRASPTHTIQHLSELASLLT